MDAYTITITPDDDSGNSTTLTVDVSTGQARITSVHMQAPTGLTGGQVPSVDVGLLLQAVTGPSHGPAAIAAAPAPEPVAAPEPAVADDHVDEPPSATVDTVAEVPVAAPARRTRRPRTAETESAPAGGARRGRAQAAGRKAAPRKAGRKPAATTADSGAERVYRRMPVDFAEVYRQAGSAAAIADHYRVPRYTAQGWIGRHKKHEAAADN